MSVNDFKDKEVETFPTSQRIVKSLAQSAECPAIAARQLVEVAKQLLQARQKIGDLVPKGLFKDSAWDMMLEMFIGGEEGDTLYVKQLMIASGETTASAMRRIDRLEGARFMERIPDPLDQRRVIVRLTERGRAAMIAMLQHVFEPQANRPTQAATYGPRSLSGSEAATR